MKLTKQQREQLKQKYGGCCSYCGTPLGDKWHADHLEAVERHSIWIPGHGFKATGTCSWPERDTLENLMPACIKCNIHKHSLPLEAWRRILESLLSSLQRNYGTYAHALRFGLVEEKPRKIVFHFESYGKIQRKQLRIRHD